MEIDKAGNVTSSVNYTPQQQVANQPNTVGSVPIPAPDTGTQVSDQISLASPPVTRKNLDMIKAIEQEHAKLNLLAKNVRMTNEELDRASGLLGRMNTTLTTIIKNNPPFPPDSEQRKELLMSYASIRQEIIKMTVPAPPQPVYEKVKSTWSSMFGQNGQILHNTVPELQASSSDSEVLTAATSLGSTGEKLANLSSGITQALIKP
jgi:hypothetical protein